MHLEMDPLLEPEDCQDINGMCLCVCVCVCVSGGGACSRSQKDAMAHGDPVPDLEETYHREALILPPHVLSPSAGTLTLCQMLRTQSSGWAGSG